MQIPKYLQHFKCIGGQCEDNCCIGWDVDVDKKTYKKYQQVKNPRMKNELIKYCKKNEYVDNEDINYAFITLTEEKRCSFLNADGFCMIQKHLGEDYLSNVCSDHPRMTHKIDGIYERSATPSCPEIARLLFENEHAMDLVTIKTPEAIKLLTYSVNTQDKKNSDPLVRDLTNIRNQCMSYFQNDQQFEYQLMQMAAFIHEKMHKQTLDVSKLLNRNSINSVSDEFKEFSKWVLDNLVDLGINDSTRFVQFHETLYLTQIELGYSKYLTFQNTYPYILRNWALNHIYKNLFPFSEGDSIEEALWLMLCRFVVVKRHLMALAVNEIELSKHIVIQYLQSFSKVIEHHKYFETHIVALLKQKKYKTKNIIEAIL